ncbi:metallophosphoesterase [Alphaproteobacteria bacterium]|nr:metallophosphoesterase [Alphaproteobacteria bacterium]GHS98875.1 metallophosphoesterase [Alphaproteobacteria bacterium]
MRILFCGDVVARSGRDVIQKYIPHLKKAWALDSVIVNGENAQHGLGLSEKVCDALYKAGVDVITTGNHVWDCKGMFSYIEKDPRVIRPINFMNTVPGKGFFVHDTPKGAILVLNAMGQVFMSPQLDNAFPILSDFLKVYPLGRNKIKAIIVDFHAEATAEKIALGYHLDGTVSLVVGTHTHVPTNDARLLDKGTAFLTDAGMCGDYRSIIGFPCDDEALAARYLKKVPLANKPEPPQGEGTLCGVFLETNDQTGLATRVHSVRLGANFSEVCPDDLPCRGGG